MAIMAPSANALQVLLNHCDEYARCHDIIYNVKKTVCMCIRPKKFRCDLNIDIRLSGYVLKYVSTCKYLGVFISNDRKDDLDVRNQTRNLYSRGNIIIRNFSKCSEQVKCHLFSSFCTSFYCAPLWHHCTIESLRRMKVAYNRIFRILLGLEYRISMSNAFVTRGLNPFIVIVRKLIVSLRKRLLNSENTLVKTIVDSLYFVNCKLVEKWTKIIFNLRN